MTFQPGDEVTVTNPTSPTGLKCGDVATVIDERAGTVSIQSDGGGPPVDVYPAEITLSRGHARHRYTCTFYDGDGCDGWCNASK